MAKSWAEQAFEAACEHHAAGRVAQGETLLKQVLQREPQHVGAIHMLGRLAFDRKQWAAATSLLERVTKLDGSSAAQHYDLGNARFALHQVDEAAAAYRRALDISPEYADALDGLATLCLTQGRYDEAGTLYERLLQRHPDSGVAHINLGFIYRRQNRYDEALAHARRGVELSPKEATAHLGLGNTLRELGRVDDAIRALRQGVELNPTQCRAHDNLVYAMLYSPTCTPEQIWAEHLRWAQAHAVGLKNGARPFANSIDPERRLRVGYCSSNIGTHIAGRLIDLILTQRDKKQMEIYCYADSPKACPETEHTRQQVDVWRRVEHLSDAQLAEQIRADRIDILVDLVSHMAKSRLLTFARRAAPVQVSHLAYPGTTGIAALDYSITDPHLNPPGQTDCFYTEELVRLPDCYWCYPPSATGPAVGPLPADATGRITFGSLNNASKLNSQVGRLWSRILERVPDSRLAVLLPGGEKSGAILRAMLEECGIAPERLVIFGSAPRDDYLALYNQVDISLDPFPYNSHTTGLDAMWMGVPLVTLEGTRAVSRAGVCLLSNVGLSELIAKTPEEYVALAVGLAEDRERLREIRAGLRGRLEKSPLLDAPRYTRNLEHLYREMWRRWCTKAVQSQGST